MEPTEDDVREARNIYAAWLDAPLSYEDDVKRMAEALARSREEGRLGRFITSGEPQAWIVSCPPGHKHDALVFPDKDGAEEHAEMFNDDLPEGQNDYAAIPLFTAPPGGHILDDDGVVRKECCTSADSVTKIFNAAHAGMLADACKVGGIVDCTGPAPTVRRMCPRADGDPPSGESVALPVTADGLVAIPGMCVVFHPKYLGSGDVDTHNEGTHAIGIFYGKDERGNGTIVEEHICDCYSTREAAAEAQRGSGEGSNAPN